MASNEGMSSSPTATMADQNLPTSDPDVYAPAVPHNNNGVSSNGDNSSDIQRASLNINPVAQNEEVIIRIMFQELTEHEEARQRENRWSELEQFRLDQEQKLAIAKCEAEAEFALRKEELRCELEQIKFEARREAEQIKFETRCKLEEMEMLRELNKRRYEHATVVCVVLAALAVWFDLMYRCMV